MKTPSPDQMRAASDWLSRYEGENGDETGEACHVVARWLAEQAQAKELRDACRDAGVPVAKMREKMREGSYNHD